jgi:hypothetical protein
VLADDERDEVINDPRAEQRVGRQAREAEEDAGQSLDKRVRWWSELEGDAECLSTEKDGEGGEGLRVQLRR